MLSSLVSMGGLSHRQLELRLDYGAGIVNRIFTGKIQLKLRHILAILEEMEIPPSQFFREVFTDEEEKEQPRSQPQIASVLMELLEARDRARGDRAREAQVQESGSSEEEMDRRVLRSLERLGFVPGR